MRIRTETHNGTLIAFPAGRIDGSNANDFARSMKAITGDEFDFVVVDGQELTDVTSAGLSAFLLVARTLSEQGSKFAVCCLSSRIRGVFGMTGFDKIIPIHATRSGALDLLEH